MQIPQAAINPGLGNLDQQRWGSVQSLIRVVNRLGKWLVLDGEGASEQDKADNALWLSSGDQGGAALSGARTRVVGASGATMTRPVTCASTGIWTTVDFAVQGGTVPLVLKAASKTVFNGCTFRNLSSDGAVLVRCEDGAVARFVGCMFYGNGLAQVVDNPGAIGNIVLVGCLNLTGAADGNVTVVG